MELTLPVSNLKIDLQPMRAKEEKILTNKKLLKAGSNIDQLLLSCIASIDSEKPTEKQILDLNSGDRNFALYHLRILSYGEDFETDELCPHCGKSTRYHLNLDELIESGAVEIKGEPKEGLEVDVELSDGTVATISGMDGHKERRLKTKENLTTSDVTLAWLKSINGEAVTAAAFENFIGKDLSKIRKAGKKLLCGLVPKVRVTCEHCDREHELAISASPDFFIR